MISTRRAAFLLCATGIAALLSSCGQKPEKKAQAFVDTYTKEFQRLSYDVSKAEWTSNTHIVEGDTMNAHNSRVAKETYAQFTGSQANIDATKKFLEKRTEFPDLLNRQLDYILYEAANSPASAGDMVTKRIKVETEAVEKLYGFDYQIDGKSVTTNEIDDILRDETNLDKRRAAWETSKSVGKNLRDDLALLQKYRNATVQPLGYTDYFSYQVSEYGMTSGELRAQLLQIQKELRPLYRELHTWARYELAKKYHQKDVPDMIPADWLPNRWGQDWTAMVHVQGMDLDSKLKEKEPEWLIKQAESFYVSLGFDSLPASFWKDSSLYPPPAGADWKKNNHASAWHMDLDKDVRSLMSIEPNADWYETTHHELGHVYYYMSYSTPNVPIILRKGANRAYHEGVGSMMGLAAMQKPFLEGIGLFPENTVTDSTQTLLREALNYIVFIPWSAGVMTDFENALYSEELPPAQYNSKWWELVEKYQGIVAPNERSSELCDAATKTHIIDDAGQYYDYAISYVLLFQLHDHIAREILHQDPHATNYYGHKEVGDFLKTILAPGATRDWRELTREATGSDLSAQAMLRYFDPLMKYLQEQNKGRKYTLPDL